MKSPKRLGEILIEKGYISKDQLHGALLEQKITDGFLGKILLDRALITEGQLIEALSEQFDIPIVDIKKQHLNLKLAKKFSSSLILDHKCFPLKEDEYIVTVAIVNPLDAVTMSKIEEETAPRKVKFVLVPQDDMEKIIQNYRCYINQNIQSLLKKKRKY